MNMPDEAWGSHLARSLQMELELLQALGVRIRRVTDLGERALNLPRHELLLLDFNLTDRQISAAIDNVLPRVGR